MPSSFERASPLSSTNSAKSYLPHRQNTEATEDGVKTESTRGVREHCVCEFFFFVFFYPVTACSLNTCPTLGGSCTPCTTHSATSCTLSMCPNWRQN